LVEAKAALCVPGVAILTSGGHLKDWARTTELNPITINKQQPNNTLLRIFFFMITSIFLTRVIRVFLELITYWAQITSRVDHLQAAKNEQNNPRLHRSLTARIMARTLGQTVKQAAIILLLQE
jgi:hypothetical protein